MNILILEIKFPITFIEFIFRGFHFSNWIFLRTFEFSRRIHNRRILHIRDDGDVWKKGGIRIIN